MLSSIITKEIELLPSEFKEKSEEVRLLQKHLHELNSKYNKKENQIDKISKEINKIENNLISNLEEISKIKSEQKLIVDSLNEESFKNFTQNFYKIPNNFQQIILIFLQFEGKYKDELNFLMIKQDNLNTLLRDSYSYFKSIEEFDSEKYESCRDKIKNLKNGDNFKFNKSIKSDKNKNNKNKLMHPFDIIIEFIDNTFKIIDNSKYNREMAKNIKTESEIKEKLFIENKILDNEIKEKQEKLKNINLYIKHINNITIKYKNFFCNSNNPKFNNTPNSKNSAIKDNENITKHSIINNDFLIRDKIILSSKINNEEKLNHKNDKIIFNNPNKILIKANINKDEKFKNNFEFAQNQNNNIFYPVNNCKKNSSNNIPSTKNSSQDLLNNPNNNIKIISIMTNAIPENVNISNNSLINTNNYDNNNTNKINSLSIDYNFRNPNNKITFGLLSMYQSTTSKKYKNKITKTNSFEQVDSGKISIYNQAFSNEPNKSISEIQDIKIQDKNPLNSNKQLYYSYQFNDDINNDNKNNKEEDEKKTIVDNFNIVKLKGNESKNIDIRKNKNFSPGIYNNSRKILKMNEKKKNKILIYKL
jgi:hypothetical protein